MPNVYLEKKLKFHFWIRFLATCSFSWTVPKKNLIFLYMDDLLHLFSLCRLTTAYALNKLIFGSVFVVIFLEKDILLFFYYKLCVSLHNDDSTLKLFIAQLKNVTCSLNFFLQMYIAQCPRVKVKVYFSCTELSLVDHHKL